MQTVRGVVKRLERILNAGVNEYKNLYSQPKPADGRGIFLPDEANFRRHTCVYGKKIERSMAGKDPLRRRIEVVNTGSKSRWSAQPLDWRYISVIPPYGNVRGSPLEGFVWEIGTLLREDFPRSSDARAFCRFVAREYRRMREEHGRSGLSPLTPV